MMTNTMRDPLNARFRLKIQVFRERGGLYEKISSLDPDVVEFRGLESDFFPIDPFKAQEGYFSGRHLRTAGSDIKVFLHRPRFS